MSVYPFGFLNQKGTYRFDGGEIAPCEDFDQSRLWIAKYAHRDGFLYPPISRTGPVDGEPLPNTERPARLHQLPISHTLRLDSEKEPSDRHRTEASVVIQLIAYLNGTWLQFGDWWFDARVPLDRQRRGCSHVTAEHFLSHGYKTWRQWPDQARTRFATTLFMFNRAPSYEADWEHFSVEYMVFDALYRTATEIMPVSKSGGHAERIDQLCRTLGLRENAELSKEFVRLRNDLFHEALWDSGQPGAARSGEAFMSQFWLRWLNERLVSAILGYKNDFLRSPWWSRGTYAFETADQSQQ